MAASAPTRSRWLYGPGLDFLLGCGGGYFLFFVAIAGVGASFVASAPVYALQLLLLFTATPHYGATLVRAYERREDRQKYRLFTLWLSLLVWGAFAVCVYDVTLGSWFLTLNLTWSPWHYSGQNYGIGLMLLGRRGVRVTPQAKRLIWASFLLSWILVVLGTHSEARSVSYTPVPVEAGASAFVFIPLGIPLHVVGTGMFVVGAAYFASLVGAAWLLRRGGASWRGLAPLAGVVLLQAVWFSLPVLFRVTDSARGFLPFAVSSQNYILLWMALAHSVQYLWVTSYYARASEGGGWSRAYWLKTFFAGSASFAVPVFLFSPDVLGRYSFDAGLGMLVASAVNLHHFVLDGAIWKLRDGRIARVLLRSPRPEASEVAGLPESLRSGRSWVWPLVVVAGTAYAVFGVVGTLELEFGFRRALERGDVARMQTAAQRMSWVGHSDFALHYDLGVLALQSGDLETARRELERSLELAPKAEAWLTLARVHARQGRWQAALDACTAALRLDPDNVQGLSQSALAWARLGRPAEAAQALARAVALAPDRQDLRARLQRLSQAGSPAPADS